MKYSLLSNISTVGIVFASIGGVILLAIILYLIIVPTKYLFASIFGGAYIPSYKLLGMRSRRVNLSLLVNSYILSKKENLGFTLDQLESHYIAGGNCLELLSTLTKAKNANIPLDVELAKVIDLSTHRLKDIIDEVIHAKVIEIKNIKAITQDSIELIVDVNATIRPRLENYVDGLGEEALKTKVKEFVISGIALVGDHKAGLASPEKIVKGWESSKVDTDCGFTLEALEISSVDIGRDIGSEMSAKRIEKEKAYAEFSATKQRNQEIMRELEMKTRVQEMKAEVLSAEAEVPKAISDAIKEGRFSIMDYYKLMNLQADTALRRSIISKDSANKKEE